jgi:hypothetical protein
MIWPLTLISPHTSSNTNAILHHPSNLTAIAIHDSNPTQHKPNPPRHIHIIFYDVSVIIYHSTPQIEHEGFNQPTHSQTLPLPYFTITNTFSHTNSPPSDFTPTTVTTPSNTHHQFATHIHAAKQCAHTPVGPWMRASRMMTKQNAR